MDEKRISRKNLNMNIALLISKRATCLRGQVGAVITNVDGRIISTGYNGPLKNENHCDGYCDLNSSCIRAVHAEANAIYNASKQGTPLEGAHIYCTHRPCRKCFEAIVQSGIKKVFYLNDYITDGQLKADINFIYQLNEVELEKLEDFKAQVND